MRPILITLSALGLLLVGCAGWICDWWHYREWKL